MREAAGPRVTVLVSLKIFDNVAASALYALKDRLGYSQIRSLMRSDYWCLSLPEFRDEEAVEVVDRLVSKTALFVNPNKHRWVIHLNADPADLLPKETEETVTAVLVEEDGDSRAAVVQEALLRRGDCGGRIEVRRGTWWVLYLGDMPSGQARALTEEIAVTRARNQGLLCNPHYQRAVVVVPQR